MSKKLTKREQALKVCHAAGAKGDHALFVRTYTENRISFGAAKSAYDQGVRFAASVARRDALAEA